MLTPPARRAPASHDLQGLDRVMACHAPWFLHGCPASSATNVSGENLIDATTVEIDNLEAPAEDINTFANVRQVTSTSARRPTSNRLWVIRRTAGRLVAQSHVCPRTQRLECSWSLDATASDGQLWRYPMQRRRGRTRRLLMPLSICNQRPLSQIRNRAL